MTTAQIFNYTYSGWLRQNRLRARRRGAYIEIELKELPAIMDDYDNKCAYCDGQATCMDFVFPICEKAPCVSANVVPCCKRCKITKGKRNIITMYKDGRLSKDKLGFILSKLNKNKYIREHLRQLLL